MSRCARSAWSRTRSTESGTTRSSRAENSILYLFTCPKASGPGETSPHVLATIGGCEGLVRSDQFPALELALRLLERPWHTLGSLSHDWLFNISLKNPQRRSVLCPRKPPSAS